MQNLELYQKIHMASPKHFRPWRPLYSQKLIWVLSFICWNMVGKFKTEVGYVNIHASEFCISEFAAMRRRRLKTWDLWRMFWWDRQDRRAFNVKTSENCSSQPSPSAHVTEWDETDSWMQGWPWSLESSQPSGLPWRACQGGTCVCVWERERTRGRERWTDPTHQESGHISKVGEKNILNRDSLPLFRR